MRLLVISIVWLLVHTSVIAGPSVYPTGTTIYDPDRAHNGYTLFIGSGEHVAVLMDMNGNVLKSWPHFDHLAGGPVRLLPGGEIIGPVGALPPHQESIALEQRDWNGRLVTALNWRDPARVTDF